MYSILTASYLRSIRTIILRIKSNFAIDAPERESYAEYDTALLSVLELLDKRVSVKGLEVKLRDFSRTYDTISGAGLMKIIDAMAEVAPQTKFHLEQIVKYTSPTGLVYRASVRLITSQYIDVILLDDRGAIDGRYHRFDLDGTTPLSSSRIEPLAEDVDL